MTVLYAIPEKTPVLSESAGPRTLHEIEEYGRALRNGFIIQVPGQPGIYCPTLLGIMAHNVDWGKPN